MSQNSTARLFVPFIPVAIGCVFHVGPALAEISDHIECSSPSQTQCANITVRCSFKGENKKLRIKGGCPDSKCRECFAKLTGPPDGYDFEFCPQKDDCPTNKIFEAFEKECNKKLNLSPCPLANSPTVQCLDQTPVVDPIPLAKSPLQCFNVQGGYYDLKGEFSCTRECEQMVIVIPPTITATPVQPKATPGDRDMSQNFYDTE